ncbi:MAG TPA: hypothetical protein VF755_23520, partial [Catenuloplanes sp.]
GDGGHNPEGGTGGEADPKPASGGKDPKIDGDFDADRAKATIAAAREGEKKARAEKKAADDRVAAILKAAGLTADGKEDPETQLAALKDRAEQAETRAQQLATRDAVRSGAAKHAGDAEALLDSQKFLSKLGDLDSTAADFSDKVADLVKAEVKANPKVAATATPGQGPGRRGADHSGGTGNEGRPKNLREAFARRHDQ